MMKKLYLTLLFTLLSFPLLAIEDIVSVIQHGIRNDGTKIGTELNDLVKNSYRKTLYFSAGTYNLTEPIVLPFDYTKNVNIVFDKNAVIKSDISLEALLKIGYSEMSTPDVTHRRFSYIEGGMFDCSNVDNGIMVNGLKQLVSLRSISLFKGKKTHIRIAVTDDFKGTGSSDTKIDNITIQGISSNEEVYGIYIDHSCCDCKISNTFIYSTKYGIVTKSAGHFLNNVHILSMHTTGGVDYGYDRNYRSTEGIRVASDGFFLFNEIYFDTIDRAIVIESDKNPTLMLDKNIFYSYLKDFGTAFIYRDSLAETPFQVKMSDCIIEVAKQGYRVFDVNPSMMAHDLANNFTFVNCAMRSAHLLNPFDFSLMQRARGQRWDAVLSPDLHLPVNEWCALGAVLKSSTRNALRIDIADDCSVELDIQFSEGGVLQIDSRLSGNPDEESFQLGYVKQGNYCVLFMKTKRESDAPIVNDLLGSGTFLTTPTKDKWYGLNDYGINEEPLSINLFN